MVPADSRMEETSAAVPFASGLFLLGVAFSRWKLRSASSSSEGSTGARCKGFGPFDLQKCARANILTLTPYRCARDDYSSGILLDANENSMGPAVSSYPHLELHRYPDPLHYDLKEKIASFRKVKKEQIFLGVGSDEAIDILFRIFCNPNSADNVVITPPTYGMYKGNTFLSIISTLSLSRHFSSHPNG